MHSSRLDQLLCRRPHNLRRNRKSSTSKRTTVRDDERINSHQLATSIHQRSTGVTWIDRGIGLNISTRLPRIIAIRILPIDSADNSTRHRKLKVSERAAERQHGLPWL